MTTNENMKVHLTFRHRLCNAPSFADVPVRRERSKVPLIVRQCVEEIERRGMEEVGIYRVSGVATDIQALKAAFDSSESQLLRSFRLKEETDVSPPADNKDVSMLMRDMDVNAIAGTLKLYFRELPEPLFTDELYPNFAGAIGWSRPWRWSRPRCSRVSSSQLIVSALCLLQLSPTAWPKRAACSTCCYRCQSPIWSPSSSCSTTSKGQSRHQ